MEVRFFLTGDDVWNFTKYSYRRPRTLLPLGILIALLVLLVFFTVSFSSPTNAFVNIFPIVLVLLVIFLLIPVLRWRTRSRTASLALQGEQIITISPAGFQHRNNLTNALVSWHAFKTITADKHNLYFILVSNRLVAHVIPRRAFATYEETEAFLRQAQTFWANRAASPPAGPAGTSATYEHWS